MLEEFPRKALLPTIECFCISTASVILWGNERFPGKSYYVFEMRHPQDRTTWTLSGQHESVCHASLYPSVESSNKSSSCKWHKGSSKATITFLVYHSNTMTHLRQAAIKMMIPCLERDLSKAMASSRRIRFAVPPKKYDFEAPAVTDGPLGQSIQAASPLRRPMETSKGLFQ
eukprot:scaffold24617_cov137-Cylindrotheca_fusiformis.AAC.1